jgi:mRNA interferase YafQ
MARARGDPPPLTPSPTAQFRRDVKRQEKRGKDLAKLWAIVETLCSRGRLAPRHRDHALGGEWKGWRDCHVEPDWVLIFKPTATELVLGRTGSHADLFE